MLSNNTIRTRQFTRALGYMSELALVGDRSFLGFLFREALGLESPPAATRPVPPHLGGHEDVTQVDEGAFDYLVSRFGIRSMVDVGCGTGGMLHYARMRGIDATGIDGDPTVANEALGIVEHDYTTGPLDIGSFDLGWAVEFVEHVEERFLPNFMATLRGCRFVFLTAAVPGQPGHHHVNCRPSEYWIATFGESGLAFDPEATEGVKEHSTMGSGFTRNAGLVFARSGSNPAPV
jgi:SAM-dependent methyltransferase